MTDEMVSASLHADIGAITRRVRDGRVRDGCLSILRILAATRRPRYHDEACENLGRRHESASGLVSPCAVSKLR